MSKLPEAFSRLAEVQGKIPPSGASRLVRFVDFGTNPGALDAKMHLPATPGQAPLVVALHGCTQNADAYDRGTGWSALAARAGFALLLPEQRRANNANGCFNWFEPGDIARIGGEAESIAQMVEEMICRNALDRSRVYITGLSAGGAMAAVMLATYPDLFAGGAIIGGLPYGCAASVTEALQRMRGRGFMDKTAAGAAVRRAAAGAAAAPPTVAIWHGGADATVAPSNMDALVNQWREVHDLPATPSRTEQGPNWARRVWQDASGRDAVETWLVPGMGHGVPIDPTGPARLGRVGPYMLDVGISSTDVIAASWGLKEAKASAPAARPANEPQVRQAPPYRAQGVQDIIETALRSAGLMR